MYMEKIKTHSYIWDTTKLCETFNVNGATILSETYEGGEIIEFDCISHICKKFNLNPTHLGQVLSGKRKSHKGWKNAS